ncbi:hypothetical protein KA107_01240 [Candidatus Pacearchaeota archaeon]|nr:hypothetical protein [Candidatus Pacearchaeota archaeon]
MEDKNNKTVRISTSSLSARIAVIFTDYDAALEFQPGVEVVANVHFPSDLQLSKLAAHYADRYGGEVIGMSGIARVVYPSSQKDFHIQAVLREFAGRPIRHSELEEEASE